MGKHPFVMHAKAAITAHQAGDHKKAQHHLGHALNVSRQAQRGVTPTTPTTTTGNVGAPGNPSAGMDTGMVADPGDSMPQQFGGVQRAPSTPTPAPMGKPATAVPAGFNRSRFASLKGR